jgi:Fe-S cluster biogenesis protein NfuA
MSSNRRADGTVEERVRLAIEEVRPALQADGGDIVLDSIEGEVVRVRLKGACARCPMAQTTLTDFVAERVYFYAPEIREVVAV